MNNSTDDSTPFIQRTQETFRMIQCDVGGQQFWIDTADISTVQHIAAVQPSQMDDGTCGSVRIGNKDVTVYDMASLLELPSNSENDSHVIILDTPHGSLGLMVQGTSTVQSISSRQITSMPQVVSFREQSCFRGVVTQGQVDESGEKVSRRSHSGGNFEEENSLIGLFLSPITLTFGIDHADQFAPPSTPHALHSAVSKTGQLVLFSINDHRQAELPFHFGLSISQILEISDVLPISPIPLAHSHIEGLIYWRGIPVPVVDLASRFGFEQSHREYNHRLLITRGTAGQPVAFRVNENVQTVRLPLENKPLGEIPELPSDLVRAVFQTQYGALLLPDLDKAFSFATSARELATTASCAC